MAPGSKIDTKDSFLYNVDEEKVTSLLEDTSLNASYFNKVCNDTITSYTGSLDSLMSDLYVQCIKDQNVDDQTLENYYLELTNMLYFMGAKLESLGIYSDMSRAAAKEVFNKTYLNSQVKDKADGKNKTTIAECTALAENQSQYESVVNSIYDHAYKVVKYKIDAAYEMVNTLRKIISRRMSENQLNPNAGSYKGFNTNKGKE